jgi:Zn-dependent M28 family amino/carboxypeptidase
MTEEGIKGGAKVPAKLAVSFSLATRSSKVETENVGGYLPGKSNPGQAVVLSAHYDHLGIVDGNIYNGADDDGTGTAAGLVMAKAFTMAAEQGRVPARSIVFLFFTGEEKGLLGSEYYTANPAFAMDSTTADLNTDMIGRQDPTYAERNKRDYLYLIGADKISAELNREVKAANQACCGLMLDEKYSDEADPNRFYYRSDHYNFAEKGVPIAFFFSGVHADYHQPTDDVEKILWPDYALRARFIYTVADKLAMREKMLVRKR